MRFQVFLTFAALACGPCLILGAPLPSDYIFQQMTSLLNAHPVEALAVNGVFVYEITQSGIVVKKWTFDLKNGQYYEGPPLNVVDTTFRVSDSDMVKIAKGELNILLAYALGMYELIGNYSLALEFAQMLDNHKAGYEI